MEDFSMKTTALACILAAGLAASAFAGPTFSLTGNIAAGLSDRPSFEEALLSLTENPNPLWGMGWELTLRRFGFGGTYMVNFSQDDANQWALDWYGEALYASYHLFGGGAFIDPFVQAGIGCAGRVSIGPYPYYPYPYYPDTMDPDFMPEGLMISLFPFAGAGVALHLDGLTVGAKLKYMPFNSPIPAAWIPGYPAGQFQAEVFAGVTFGR
jgi:hypothetical protein